MSKKIQPPYLNIWEQWLQKLSGSYAVEIKDDINRFELIELLATPTDINSLLCCRLGTVFNHFFPVDLITIHNQDDNSLIFSTIPRSEEVKINQRILPTITSSKNRGENRIKLNINLKGEHKQLNYLYQLKVVSPKDRFVFSFLSTLPLENRERRFLEAVHSLLRLRQQTAESTLELSSQNERLKTINQHLSEGLMIINKDLIIESWNRPMQHITGFAPTEAVNKHYRQIFYRTDLPDWLRSITEEIQHQGGTQVFRQEFQIKTKNGKQKWVNISGSVLLDQNCKPTQIICIVRDVSKFKELELRKSEFISIATHELRTPITAVKGYLSLIEKNMSEISEKQQNYIRQAIAANERLVKLAEDLLQVVHVEEEQLKFDMQPMAVSPIIRKVCRDFRGKASKKFIKLIIDNRAEKSPIIVADPIRFEQVMSNLIDNAIKYTHTGEIRAIIQVHTNRSTKEEEVSIAISDTGTGINGRDLETIFNKFRRTDSAHRSRESGAGLGLFIVKSFVEKQDGKISVISRLGKGSTFTVTFPTIERKKQRRKNDKKHPTS